MNRTHTKVCISTVLLTVLLSLMPASVAARGEVLQDLAYCNPPAGASRSLDLYLPRRAKKKNSAPLPLVIWIHGGGWRAGDKKNGPFKQLINAGFAVASINYRLSQEAHFPAQIEDCKTAVIFLKKHAKRFNIDPNRVGVWGASAGGHLAALLGATSGSRKFESRSVDNSVNSDVQAVCDWFGPIDLLKLVKYDAEEGEYKVHPIVDQLLGVTGVRRVDAAREASPLTYLTAKMPPVLIMHGDRDRLVPIEQSKIFIARLKELDVDSRLKVVSGGHGIPGFGLRQRAEVVRFFERCLMGKSPAR